MPAPPWVTTSQHKQTAHPHDAIHAVCHLPCTVKTRIHPWREHLSKVTDAIECEHLPTQVSYDDELLSGRDPDEDDEHADELPWDGFWQFVQKFFGYAKRLLQQLSGWLSQTILEVKMLDVEVLGWSGYTWSAVGCTAKFSETPLEMAYGREMNIQFTGNCSGGHSCSQRANCTLPQNLDICGLVLWWNCTF